MTSSSLSSLSAAASQIISFGCEIDCLDNANLDNACVDKACVDNSTFYKLHSTVALKSI